MVGAPTGSRKASRAERGRRISLGRGVALAVALAVIVVLGYGRAVANQFGPGGDEELYFPDNGTHTYCVDTGGNQSYRDALTWARDHLDNHTDMSTTFSETCQTQTDVWFYAEYLGGCCLWGTWDCFTWNGAGECETGDMKLNRSALDGKGQDNKDKVACHEQGHSVGLGHDNGSTTTCMAQGIDGPPKVYNGHDKDHINGKW
jgi:hypothetical protein